MRVVLLNRDMDFPDPEQANAEGLVALGGDLSVPRLLKAYSKGLFPWTADPITWWSPDPRAIFEMDALRVPRSFRRVLKQQRFRVTRDQDFKAVIEGCAAPAPGRRETWISKEFLEAYRNLHAAGHAHSVECWLEDRLVGGIYGVAIGGLFAGESMFHTVTEASKVALYHLFEHLKAREFQLFDVQMVTPITHQFGAVSIPRAEYLSRLRDALDLDCRF